MKIGKLNINKNSKFFKVTLYALLIFFGYSVADLTIIYFRDLLIPEQAPPKKIVKLPMHEFVDRSLYSVISNRNLFSSAGIMPEPIKAEIKEEEKKEAAPVPSTLPLNLIGTLVHSNPAKSIAAIEVKSKNMTGSYQTGAEVEGLATIEKVERNIVYIRNISNGAPEYIEMKGANKVTFDASKAEIAKPAAGKEVVSTGGNTFQIKRADLMKYTNDLSSVLMQARAVPNRDPNTGEINGFRILDMQPGSIYEQLGLKPMDVIKGVNGEPVDSIQKAMEFYNTFKNSNQVKLQIERGGKNDSFIYDVK